MNSMETEGAPMSRVETRKKKNYEEKTDGVSENILQSIGAAATILQNGAERLKKSEQEKGSKHRGLPDFHFELLRLRSSWRLKKAGNTIIGDLSYKSSTCCSLQLQ